MKRLNFEEQYFSPSEQRTINNGSSASLQFRGLSGNLFVANRFTIGCSDPSALNQMKATLRTIDKKIYYFSDVSLLTIKRLFEDMSIMGGIDIHPDRALEMVVSNESGATQTINVRLNGFDVVQFEEKMEQYEAAGREWPNIEFGYADATIIADADNQSVPIQLPAEDVWLNRIAISSEDDEDLSVKLVINNDEIIPSAFINQINDEFKTKRIITPVLLKKNIPVELRVSNLDAVNTRSMSALFECYKV